MDLLVLQKDHQDLRLHLPEVLVDHQSHPKSWVRLGEKTSQKSTPYPCFSSQHLMKLRWIYNVLGYMLIPFIQFIPEVKDNDTFWDTIPTSVDKDFISGHVAGGQSWRIFRVDNFYITIIKLTRFRDFNGSGMLLWNAALVWLYHIQSKG